MGLGKKLSNLRKKNGLSQEDLAEKLDVTRQTISKWELNETNPNIIQEKEISKLFNISLDALVGNNIEEILIKKMNKTEKRMDIIMKFNIVMLILLLLIFVIIFITIVTSLDYFSVSPTGQGIGFTCKIGENPVYYDYMINMDMDGNITSVEGSEVIDFSEYTDGQELNNAIVQYYESNDGKCGISEE